MRGSSFLTSATSDDESSTRVSRVSAAHGSGSTSVASGRGGASDAGTSSDSDSPRFRQKTKKKKNEDEIETTVRVQDVVSNLLTDNPSVALQRWLDGPGHLVALAGPLEGQHESAWYSGVSRQIGGRTRHATGK
jgi:hypothetical protein